MIKSILFKLDLEGKGVVNFDSKDQKYIYSREKYDGNPKSSRYDNVSYAKKNFYRDKEGNLVEKIKISSDCVKNAMFNDVIIAQSPNIMHHDSILYSYIASPELLVRGYMLAKNKETIKRVSALKLMDAEITNDVVSNMEIHTKTGEKTSKKNEDDKNDVKSDNTLHYRENIGESKYSTIGGIDLDALQFVSCDLTLDRYAFNPDLFGLYKQFLSMRMDGVDELDLKYYKLTNSVVDLSEYGFLLTNEQIVFLVKQTLKRLLGINIKRRNAFAKTCGLKIKLVENPLKDTYESNDGWIEINSTEDIDSLNFDAYQFYTEVNSEEELKKRAEIEAEIKRMKADKKTKKK